MSSDVPELYPVIVVEDRYQGVYSGGPWWAVARGDTRFESATRIDWVMHHGPSADDVTCAGFWARKPPWIAAGRTPDEAVAKLVVDPDAGSNNWSPAGWADDPKSARWD